MARRFRSEARPGGFVSAKQQILSAALIVLLIAAAALVSWSYRSRHPAAGAGTGDVTVSVTSPADLGAGSLREALFIAASARGQATVLLVTRKVTLKTALPPLMNPHGMRLIGQPAGAEIDAQGLTSGSVLDVAGPNTSIEGIAVRHCPGAAVLLRAVHFHLQASVLESCDVGVEIASNADDILLDGNRFAGDRIGVRFAAPIHAAVVVGNTFSQAGAAGLWAVSGEVAAAANPIRVRDNHFTGNHGGIVAGNIPIVIEHDDFAGNAPDPAIHLVGAGAVIRDNRIGGPGAMGIVAEGARAALIDGNDLHGLSSYALMLRSSAGATVRANRIAGCASGMAFVLGDPQHASTVVGNTISDPKLNAIDVIGDSPILRDNQVVRPRALALRVMDYDPPGGPSVRAHPSLQGNNFRPNIIGTTPAAEPATTAAIGRQ